MVGAQRPYAVGMKTKTLGGATFSALPTRIGRTFYRICCFGEHPRDGASGGGCTRREQTAFNFPAGLGENNRTSPVTEPWTSGAWFCLPSSS